MFDFYSGGTHHIHTHTTDRPGDPFADVRAQLTIDTTGDAEVHIHSNARVFASGKSKVYIYGNACVYAWDEAQVFFLGEGSLDIGGHARAHTSAAVRTIATEHAEVDSSGDTFAWGQSVVRAAPACDRVHRRSPYATVIRGDDVEAPASTFRPGYVVIR